MSLELMYITNDVIIGKIAEKAGVDRIWIDLETLGKEERQKGLNTVKSHHTIKDVAEMAKVITTAKLQVRINPWNANSKKEIDEVILAGAKYIMLPMWRTVSEVREFIDYVNRRVNTILLLETIDAERCLNDVLKISGVEEIHIGLNDLHLEYGLTFMFELLSNGTVERIVDQIKNAGKKYGFGGISHLGDGIIPAEMIIKEHYRLGSTRAILSRGFCDLSSNNYEEIEKTFTCNVKELRKYEDYVSVLSKRELLKNKDKLQRSIKCIVEKKNG